jgi:carbamoyltransferase
MKRVAGNSGPLILGIAASHNGGACLLRGNRIVVAIQEERLARHKRKRVWPANPSLSVNYCLQAAGMTIDDVDMVVVCTQNAVAKPENNFRQNPQLKSDRKTIPILSISHHLGHALAAFATSPFERAAVMVIDGLGSPTVDMSPDERNIISPALADCWETASLYFVDNSSVTPLQKHVVGKGKWRSKSRHGMPRFAGLGGMYSAAARQIFGNSMDAGKVMGLAAFGAPEFPVDWFFSIADTRLEFHDVVPGLFQNSERWPANSKRYANLAASTQNALEVGVLHLAQQVRTITGCADLAYAGGVALNSIANERIIRETSFERVHIMPAAEDNGTAIGAAYYGLWQLSGTIQPNYTATDSLGSVYATSVIDISIRTAPGLIKIASNSLINDAVERLIQGQACGWFQGGSEFGPRALGGRSILCDARNRELKDRLNKAIKLREDFRPFAPIVLAECVDEWFDVGDVDGESPFMLRVMSFRHGKTESVPAVVHADGTGRLQTVDARNGRLYDLLRRFHQRTGIPILLNTSFNVADEPIVESPTDALWCLLETPLDFCVLEDRLVTKSESWRSILDLIPRMVAQWPTERRSSRSGSLNPFGHGRSSEEKFCVATEFGVTTQYVAKSALKVLSHIDGIRDGWSVCRNYFGRAPESDDIIWMHRTLATLRRAHVISFIAPEHSKSAI